MATWLFIAIITLLLFIVADRMGEWLSRRSSQRAQAARGGPDDNAPNLPGD
jgi:hypothetical protein